MYQQRRAPVDAIDTVIAQLSVERDVVCGQMASGKTDAATLAELLNVTERIVHAQVERSRIISEFFYGKRGAL